MVEQLTSRPPAGTQLLYRGGDGRLYAAYAGHPEHDSPGGEWVWVEFGHKSPGPSGTWARQTELFPYDSELIGSFIPAQGS